MVESELRHPERFNRKCHQMEWVCDKACSKCGHMCGGMCTLQIVCYSHGHSRASRGFLEGGPRICREVSAISTFGHPVWQHCWCLKDITHRGKTCVVGAAIHCAWIQGLMPELALATSPSSHPVHTPWVRRSPEVQLQLCVQEVEQRPPGHSLCVAVVDHQALVTDVLTADALGP